MKYYSTLSVNQSTTCQIAWQLIWFIRGLTLESFLIKFQHSMMVHILYYIVKNVTQFTSIYFPKWIEQLYIISYDHQPLHIYKYKIGLFWMAMNHHTYQCQIGLFWMKTTIIYYEYSSTECKITKFERYSFQQVMFYDLLSIQFTNDNCGWYFTSIYKITPSNNLV